MPSDIMTEVVQIAAARSADDDQLSSHDPSIALSPVPWGALFIAALADHARRPALTYRGKSLSYANLALRIDASTNILRRMGAGPGVRVGLLLPNNSALWTYTLAAFALGSTIVGLDPAGSDADLADCVKKGRVSILITCDLQPLQARASALALTSADLIRAVIVVRYTSLLSGPKALAHRLLHARSRRSKPTGLNCPVHWERDVLRDARLETLVPVGPTPRPAGRNETALLACSRTKNGPRYAEFSHANLAAILFQVRAALPPLKPGLDHIIVALPLWHPLAMAITAGLTLTQGCELTMVHQQQSDTLIADLKRSKPTYLIVTAPLLAELLANPGLNQFALMSLQCVLVVGSSVSPALLAAFTAVSPAPVLQCYSPSNMPTVIAISRTNAATDPATFYPVARTTLSVRDLADPSREVPRGERGELCVSGPQVPTRERVSPNEDLFIADLLRSGDLAIHDAQGRVVIVDRIEDLIEAAGYVIYPRRIEQALLEHSGVSDAAVIGIGDARRGQAPKAFVVLKRGQAITERDLRLFLAERISRIEMPADIDFATTLPQTPYGIVCKTTLRKQEAARNA